MPECPSTNTASADQSSFWDSDGLHWDAHRIGWIVSGSFAIATLCISFTHVLLHLRSYYVPKEQRQIVRIILLPPVYAVVSFFSYRFYRSATYYVLAETAYEALAIAAFLLLLLYYVGDSTDKQREVFLAQPKRKVPFPFCCWRFRPGKPYVLAVLKWSVLQYCFVRPLISIAGIICQAFNVLCEDIYSVHFAQVYLEAVDFVSISVALEGLIVLYTTLRTTLAGRRPLAKFLAIKIVIFFTFYQGFVYSALAKHGVLKATDYWTSTNIAQGLQALTTTIECVLFAGYNFWAFPPREYRHLREAGAKPTNVFRAFLHSQNYWDFVKEFWLSLAFGVAFLRHKPGTRLEKDERGFKGAAMHGDGSLAHEMGERRRADLREMEESRPLRWQTAPSPPAMASTPDLVPPVNATRPAERPYSQSAVGHAY